MRHAVIAAHPNADSFTLAAARTYVAEVEAGGGQAVLRDLYRMQFDPALHADELPDETGVRPRQDVVAERELIADAGVFVFVYPFWFNGPPAMLKGYVDRVFGMGFGFEPVYGGTTPLLGGRRLLSISFSGAPDAWVQETHALDALVSGFDRHVCAVTGLAWTDHLHVGSISPNMTREAGELVLGQVRALARRL